MVALASQTSEPDMRVLLERLDPMQSIVLQMLYFERNTHQEIAERLKLSRRAVSRKSAAGLQALALLIMAPVGE